MTFDLRQYIFEQNDARIDEAAFSSDDARAIRSLRASGGAKAVLSKAGSGALSGYSWSPRSSDGYAVQFVKDGNQYNVTLMPIEDGDPTGQTEKEHSGTDLQAAVSAAKGFLRKVK